jgi:hypothetical protein
VHNWVRERKDYLPKDFITNKQKRTEVIREVAQLDIDVQKQAGDKRVSVTARNQYLEKNVTKYPSLDAERIPKIEEKRRAIPDVIDRPEKQPAVKIMKPAQVLDSDAKQMIVRPPHKSDAVQEPANQPPVKIVKPAQESDAIPRETQRPAYRPDTAPQPAKQQPARIERPVQETVTKPRQPAAAPAYNFNKIQNAQEYQRNIWEQTQPTARPQPQPVPRPQVEQARPAPRPQVQQAQPAPRPQVQPPARPAPVSRPDRSKDQ